jgi:hypothetical protein
MTAHTWALVSVLVVAAGGCGKTDATSTGESKASAARTGASVPAASGASDDGEGIATEEDFEDEAEQKINPQNADEELDKLEKEITD